MYRYSFAYQGIHEIDGVSYYKFDVSALKYYIFNNTTIFADADEEISSPLLLSHINDVYIPLDEIFTEALKTQPEAHYYSGDGVHPNGNGSVFIGELYAKTIAELI